MYVCVFESSSFHCLNIQFRDPIVTSDCLFSLINGDDMFATYKGMSKAPTAAYIFSKVYLYIFIALFIYVVLSVFISLISDTYETLHVSSAVPLYSGPPLKCCYVLPVGALV